MVVCLAREGRRNSPNLPRRLAGEQGLAGQKQSSGRRSQRFPRWCCQAQEAGSGVTGRENTRPRGFMQGAVFLLRHATNE